MELLPQLERRATVALGRLSDDNLTVPFQFLEHGIRDYGDHHWHRHSVHYFLDGQPVRVVYVLLNLTLFRFAQLEHLPQKR